MTSANIVLAKNTVKISTGEWAPWCGEKLKHKGFVLHIVAEAFKRVGYKTQFDFFPWKRAYAEMKHGYHDASAYWYGNSKITKECSLSTPLTKEVYVFFYHITNPIKGWKSFDDFKGLRVGIVKGFSYTDEFWDAINKGIIRAEPVRDDSFNILKLAQDRIDIVPLTVVMGTMLINETLAPEIAASIKYDEKPLSVKNGHLAFSKTKKDSIFLRDLFNNGLKQIRDDGTYERCMNNLLSGVYSH